MAINNISGYPPRAFSYSGGVGIQAAPGGVASGIAAAGPAPLRDEYIPSFAVQGAGLIATMPRPLEPPPAPDDAPINAEESEGADGTDNADSADDAEFTPEEQKVIDELKVIDKRVRDHEQAHISAGGPYITGGATFEYERGPDDKRYAVGGEVGIDVSPIRDNPEATIAKMQVVRSAALAPADPSAQDRAVAASASRNEGVARAELSEKRAAEARGEGRDVVRQASRVASDAVEAYANAVSAAKLFKR